MPLLHYKAPSVNQHRRFCYVPQAILFIPQKQPTKIINVLFLSKSCIATYVLCYVWHFYQCSGASVLDMMNKLILDCCGRTHISCSRPAAAAADIENRNAFTFNLYFFSNSPFSNRPLMSIEFNPMPLWFRSLIRYFQVTIKLNQLVIISTKNRAPRLKIEEPKIRKLYLDFILRLN